MKYQIKDFTTMGGKHCITTALRQVFHYYAHPISEEMLFGLGCGLSFCYVNVADAPMISGRSKVFALETTLAKRLQIQITCKQPKTYVLASAKAKQMIERNEPVLIYVDMPYLSYLNLNPNSHFGGHGVVLFGYDDELHQWLISDRDHHDYPIRTPLGMISEDEHIVSDDELAKARGSAHRPFPANHKYLVFDLSNMLTPNRTMIFDAIQATCEHMLFPEASLLGLSGIQKFAREVRKWECFSIDKRKRTGIKNYFMIHCDGGTGGGIFRRMYGEFLIEVGEILQDTFLTHWGTIAISISEKWDEVALLLWDLGIHGECFILDDLANRILAIHAQEQSLYEHVYEHVKTR